MPKMKTHSGTKKRFRATGTGKLRGRSAFSSHILEKKSAKRKRRLAQPAIISTRDRARIRELLGAKAPHEAKRAQAPPEAKGAQR